MFRIDDVIEFYEKDQTIARLKKLDEELRRMQLNSGFREAEAIITRGERLLREHPNVNPELMEDITNFRKLKQQREEMISRKAIRPPIEEGFYAEWKDDTIRLVLPFQFEQPLLGLPLWYSVANRRLVPWYSNNNYRGYTSLEIPNVPNEVRAKMILQRMVTPPEFRMLNITLLPTLFERIIPNGQLPMDDTEFLEEKYKNVQPIKRRKLIEIWNCVSQHYDKTGEGLQPKEVLASLKRDGLIVPSTKLGTYMVELVKGGDLLTTGVPSTHTVRYFPSYAVVSENQFR